MRLLKRRIRETRTESQSAKVDGPERRVRDEHVLDRHVPAGGEDDHLEGAGQGDDRAVAQALRDLPETLLLPGVPGARGVDLLRRREVHEHVAVAVDLAAAGDRDVFHVLGVEESDDPSCS